MIRTLTRAQLSYLRWAIEKADFCRGSMIGNPDPRPLRVHDRMIANAYKALNTVREQQTFIRKVAK